MDESRIEEGIAEVVLHLTNAPAAMYEHLVKPSILRSVRVAEPKVPLAEDGTVVAVRLEKLGQYLLVLVQDGSARYGSEDP